MSFFSNIFKSEAELEWEDDKRIVFLALKQFIAESKRVCVNSVAHENFVALKTVGAGAEISVTDRVLAFWTGVSTCAFLLVLFHKHQTKGKEILELFEITSDQINDVFNGAISNELTSQLGFGPAMAGKDAVEKHWLRTREYAEEFPPGYLINLAGELADIGYEGALLSCSGPADRRSLIIKNLKTKTFFLASANAVVNFATSQLLSDPNDAAS